MIYDTTKFIVGVVPFQLRKYYRLGKNKHNLQQKEEKVAKKKEKVAKRYNAT